MIEKLFLTGPSGSGKTTNILRILDSVQGEIGGFVVQRIRSGERILGYAMISAKEARQVWVEASEPTPHCFLTMENAGLRFHPERFTENFLQLTHQGDLILLDEIGGMELNSPEIRLRLAELLDTGLPLLAVWKSKENLLHMIQHGKAPVSLVPFHQEIESLIQSHEKAAIVSESPSQEMLLRFLKMNGLHKDVPGRDYCQKRLRQCSLPIQAHSLMVTRLVEAFIHYFHAEDPESLIQAALLHDVERHQEGHASLIAKLLLEQGYTSLAFLVGQHMVLSQEFYQSDAALLWLADKCCLEDQLVHPQIRFQASIDKYGPTESIQANLKALASFQLSEQWDPKKILDQYGGHHENDLFSIKDLLTN